jgi:drug/metabolite transporter (DMT)-like permease
MQNKRVLIAHLAILSACAIWGLMAPIGKDAMLSGVDNLNMVYLRALGGAVFFWITSLFTKHEHVPLKDIFVLCGAGVFGLVCNQCCFTIGLSITTPSNAAIVTTSLPIFAMIFAALILKEPITGRKALGVGVGCSGAVILIASTAVANDSRIGDIRGDLLCVAAQMSFALYLSLYRSILKRYSPITMSKWMFTLLF